jgi:hypothetical protein
MDYFQTL